MKYITFITIFITIMSISLLFYSCGKEKEKNSTREQLVTKTEMDKLIEILIEDYNQHEKIGTKLTDLEIEKVENQLGVPLPYSYKLFLKQFGNGGYWIYMTSIDDIKQFSYLGKYRKDLGKTIELVGEKEIQTDSLLCLMTEDSNGGAWCWLTSENLDSGEWPLAYYSLHDKKLHYKVENFIEWLRLLTKCKSEVIRELDLENKLELG